MTEWRGKVRIVRPAVRPKWLDSLGEWIEEWDDRQVARGKSREYINGWEWIVGTSEPVRGASHVGLARQLASQNAIFHLVRALGFDVKTRAKTGKVWATTATGTAVSAMFRKALTEEFFSNKINFREYAGYTYTWYEPRVVGGEVGFVIVNALFRMDMTKFHDKQNLERAKENFERQLQGSNLTQEERKKAMQLAKQAFDKAAKR